MDTANLGPTDYSADRWAICLRDRARQFVPLPHRGRAVGAVLSISPNAITAREALRVLELDGVARAMDFIIISIASMETSKRAILQREYRLIQSESLLATRGASTITCGDKLATLALQRRTSDAVDVVWQEGSLQQLPESVDESQITHSFASSMMRAIVENVELLDEALRLARHKDRVEQRICDESRDEDEFFEKMGSDLELHQISITLDQQLDHLEGRLRRLAKRVESAGIEVQKRDDGTPTFVPVYPGALPVASGVLPALTRVFSELSLHTLSSYRIPPLRPDPDEPDISEFMRDPAPTGNALPVSFAEPNLLTVDKKTAICNLSSNRLKLLKALVAAGGSVPAAAFASKGEHCIWPEHRYPPDDSDNSRKRRDRLHNAVSSMIHRLNADLRKLNMPRALTVRLSRGAIVLDVV